MSTTTTSRNLTSVQSITYIKPTTIRIDVSDVRPNTTLYPFFDGQRIDSYCRMFLGTSGTNSIPVGEINSITDAEITPTNLTALGAPLVSNAAGELVVYFLLPGGTFTTGDKEILFTDVTDINQLLINGNTYGSARATFQSKGTQQIYQTTYTTNTVETSYNTIVMTAPPRPIAYDQRYDPIAQSFFTYGITGGLFVTSIDLFFESKDATLPVRVELRKMTNGFPAEYDYGNPNLVSVVNAADVNISDTALVPTNFKFPVPVYLPGDSDFCFVIVSNSNNYNIWTSKVGETSIETGKAIYEQPYIGSLFKSENNFTWTAEQFEDIKFTLNKAVFNTAITADLTFTGATTNVSVNGDRMTTKNGSNLIVYRAQNMHGLTAGSKIRLLADMAGTYNGISGFNISGASNVTRVIDDYTVEFQIAAGTATSTGKISSCNIVRYIAILNAGTGYTSAPTITIGAPGSGTTATATCTVVNGSISTITITNPGSGYTSAPAVIVSGGGGSGATLIASNDAIIAVNVNKPVHVITPQLKSSILPNTNISATIKLPNRSYGYQNPIPFDLNNINYLPTDSMIASRDNEFTYMSNGNSLELHTLLSSTNPNLSPVIDMSDTNGLLVYGKAINQQAFNESLTSTISSSGVISVAISSGGSGYASAPTVTVIPAENENNFISTTATITATLTSGVVTSLTITNAGAGYTKAPLIVIAPPTSGTTATASSTIDQINSELNTQGNSYSRYITKKISLETISTGIRVYVVAISTMETTFDWYIRTSLSGDTTSHESATWQILSCNTPRNKSTNPTQSFEYEFFLDNIAKFDTYDMKMVPSSLNMAKSPSISQYRVIVVA